MIETLIVSEPIDVAAISRRVIDPAAGGTALFIGTVRQSSGNRERQGRVIRLEYEAYVPMAEKEMNRIACDVLAGFGGTNLILHHRVGTLQITDIAVCVAVSTPHRGAAFDACRRVIEELKKHVPIWKKEVFEDGAEWVDPRP